MDERIARYEALVPEHLDGLQLGCVCRDHACVWRLWSPLAKSVTLKCNGVSYAMTEQDHTWVCSLEGDYHLAEYSYVIQFDRYEEEIPDPYAVGCRANGFPSVAVNRMRTHPEGWEDDRRPTFDDTTKRVVWEMHVGDFSAAEPDIFVHPGKFLAFTEEPAIRYLKDLGVTHVQLMPIFDYATVDEKKESGLANDGNYNWGYDPANFNCVEGSYATGPDDPVSRIRELKQLVSALHRAGIGVVMDVVYNHMYEHPTPVLERACPGYYFRAGGNASGCGNEVATERTMVRQYLLDSLRYWQSEYHLDGFRFDLMGVFDQSAVKEIQKSLRAAQNAQEVLLYGEPWSALPPTFDDPETDACDRDHPIDGVGYFNDAFRDCTRRFATGQTGFEADFAALLQRDDDSVNYTSCHDDLTLWDAIHKEDHDYDGHNLISIAQNKLAAALTLTARGIALMLGGEENARTKHGHPNTYNAGFQANRFSLQRANDYAELHDYYRGLICIVRRYGFNGPKQFFIVEPRLLAYYENRYALIFNASDETKTISLKSGHWKILVNETSSEIGLDHESDELAVPPRAFYLLEQKESD